MAWRRLEVIQFSDNTGRTIVARVPSEGTADIQVGAQLIVEQSQEAVFFRDGKALDVFGPGRHTLTTQNVPFLTGLLTIPWEKSPFQAAVVFVGKQTFMDQKWGTSQPITVRDQDFGMVRLRAFGRYAFRVSDSAVFVNTVVGTAGKTSTDQVADFLREMIVSRLVDLLGTAKLSLLDLPARFDEIATGTRAKLGDSFAKYGLELTDFFLSSITPPEEVQKAIDARSAMGAIGDLRGYTAYQAANSMSKMAERGGTGSDAMSMGMGAGMGFLMPQMMREAMAGQGGSGVFPPGGGTAPNAAGGSAPTSTQPGQPAPNVAPGIAASTGGVPGGVGARMASAPSGGFDFADLGGAPPAASADQSQTMIREICQASSWSVAESDSEWKITIPVSTLRKQVVRVRFDRKDAEGNAMLEFRSFCGPMNPEAAMTLLKYNAQLVHGAFTVEGTDSGDMVVLQSNSLAGTATPYDVTRALSSLAWQADRVEERLIGKDEN